MDFDPATGREPGGRRSALVVSDAPFTAATGLAVVCPMTSRVRPFPTRVVLPEGLAVSGEILLSHIRSIDTLARPVRFAGGSVPAAVAALVRAKLGAIVAI
jgi:mRNA interferase MazF